MQLRESGLTIKMDGDALRVSPKDALTDETRALIRAHKAELLDALSTPDPATERRRVKALAMLDADPKLRIALVVSDPDSDPVLVTIGIHQVAVGEIEIPHAYYNPVTLMELLDQHTGATP
jgi:hypothetical protein